jgi:hypothetical protein
MKKNNRLNGIVHEKRKPDLKKIEDTLKQVMKKTSSGLEYIT